MRLTTLGRRDAQLSVTVVLRRPQMAGRLRPVQRDAEGTVVRMLRSFFPLPVSDRPPEGPLTSASRSFDVAVVAV
ncbi:hypothetical protein GCM10023080_065870 [Streptomyces pseudoechinosporeus]